MIKVPPTTLTALPNWVLWRKKVRNGKTTKVPFQPDGKAASSTDPLTWKTYEQCVPNINNFSGLGFVLTPEIGLVGIDVDHCRDKTSGWLNDLAQDLMLKFDTYTEITPSQEGLRFFLYGKLPDNKGRKKPDIGLEIYNSGRFLTVTGNVVNNQEINNCQYALDKLMQSLFPPAVIEEHKSNNKPCTLSAEQVIERALKDPLFKCLFNRLGPELNDYRREDGSLDDSSLDMALCCKLAFYCECDEQLMLEVMQQSHLWRSKWERNDYSSNTIKRSIEFFKSNNDSGVVVSPTNSCNERIGAQEGLLTSDIRFLDILADDFLIGGDFKWLIPNLIPQGATMIIPARAKLGKTIIVMYMMYCLTYKVPLFNEPVGECGDIIFLDYENMRQYIQHWAKTFIGIQDGRLWSEKVKYACHGDQDITEGRVPEFLTIDYLDRATKGRPTGLIVVDTVRGAFGASPNLKPGWENQADIVGAFLRPIQTWAHKTGWSVIFLHHTTHTGRSSGSTEFLASVDYIATVSRTANSNDNLIQVMGRYFEQPGDRVLRFEEGRLQYLGLADQIKEIDREARSLLKQDQWWRSLRAVLEDHKQYTAMQLRDILKEAGCTRAENQKVCLDTWVDQNKLSFSQKGSSKFFCLV